MKHMTLALVAAFLLAGCPGNEQNTGPVDICEKTGQQCRMSKGKLGVCSLKTDGTLYCMSQH